ncbi:hypothetical protein ABZ806_38565 [Spirillospora sp. NPDC047418]
MKTSRRFSAVNRHIARVLPRLRRVSLTQTDTEEGDLGWNTFYYSDVVHCRETRIVASALARLSLIDLLLAHQREVACAREARAMKYQNLELCG